MKKNKLKKISRKTLLCVLAGGVLTTSVLTPIIVNQQNQFKKYNDQSPLIKIDKDDINFEEINVSEIFGSFFTTDQKNQRSSNQYYSESNMDEKIFVSDELEIKIQNKMTEALDYVKINGFGEDFFSNFLEIEDINTYLSEIDYDNLDIEQENISKNLHIRSKNIPNVNHMIKETKKNIAILNSASLAAGLAATAFFFLAKVPFCWWAYPISIGLTSVSIALGVVSSIISTNLEKFDINHSNNNLGSAAQGLEFIGQVCISSSKELGNIMPLIKAFGKFCLVLGNIISIYDTIESWIDYYK
ncbi:MAG: hypothetical protein ACRCVI_00270 [Mycoplasmoidaceae bacterium]